MLKSRSSDETTCKYSRKQRLSSQKSSQVWPICLVTLCLALFCSSAPSIAATDPSPNPSASITPTTAPMSPVDLARNRIDTMLRTGHADSTWFSATFLAHVPASEVDQVIAGLKGTLGEYKSVEFTPAKFVAHFAKGTDDVIIHLDADNKIDALLFRPPALAAASLEDSLRALRSSSGILSYVIIEEGRSERAALNASEPLAVGSAFKLAVMNALYDEVMDGHLHYSDVVPLKPEWKSLPSGILRDLAERNADYVGDICGSNDFDQRQHCRRCTCSTRRTRCTPAVCASKSTLPHYASDVHPQICARDR